MRSFTTAGELLPKFFYECGSESRVVPCVNYLSKDPMDGIAPADFRRVACRGPKNRALAFAEAACTTWCEHRPADGTATHAMALTRQVPEQISIIRIPRVYS